MPNDRARSPQLPGPLENVVESFLRTFIADHPQRGFGAIVRAAQESARVSRSTAAHHLARLVQYGEVVLLPNRTYVLASSGPFYARPTVEILRFEGTAIVRPDGTALGISRLEFRVRAGRLDHYDVTYVAAPEEFRWECSVPSRLGRNPLSESVHPSTYRIDFAEPLSARDPGWQWLLIRTQMPVVFHMVRSPGPTDEGARSRRVTQEAEYSQVSSEGPLIRKQFVSDSLIRLEIVFPEGYPVHQVEPRVRFVAEPNHFDRAEEDRIQKLTQDASGPFGFRNLQSYYWLTIPSPRPDRRYAIEWKLPTPAERERWLKSHFRPS